MDIDLYDRVVRMGHMYMMSEYSKNFVYVFQEQLLPYFVSDDLLARGETGIASVHFCAAYVIAETLIYYSMIYCLITAEMFNWRPSELITALEGLIDKATHVSTPLDRENLPDEYPTHLEFMLTYAPDFLHNLIRMVYFYRVLYLEYRSYVDVDRHWARVTPSMLEGDTAALLSSLQPSANYIHPGNDWSDAITAVIVDKKHTRVLDKAHSHYSGGKKGNDLAKVKDTPDGIREIIREQDEKTNKIIEKTRETWARLKREVLELSTKKRGRQHQPDEPRPSEYKPDDDDNSDDDYNFKPVHRTRLGKMRRDGEKASSISFARNQMKNEVGRKDGRPVGSRPKSDDSLRSASSIDRGSTRGSVSNTPYTYNQDRETDKEPSPTSVADTMVMRSDGSKGNLEDEFDRAYKSLGQLSLDPAGSPSNRHTNQLIAPSDVGTVYRTWTNKTDPRDTYRYREGQRFTDEGLKLPHDERWRSHQAPEHVSPLDAKYLLSDYP